MINIKKIKLYGVLLFSLFLIGCGNKEAEQNDTAQNNSVNISATDIYQNTANNLLQTTSYKEKHYTNIDASIIYDGQEQSMKVEQDIYSEKNKNVSHITENVKIDAFGIPMNVNNESYIDIQNNIKYNITSSKKEDCQEHDLKDYRELFNYLKPTENIEEIVDNGVNYYKMDVMVSSDAFNFLSVEYKDENSTMSFDYNQLYQFAGKDVKGCLYIIKDSLMPYLFKVDILEDEEALQNIYNSFKQQMPDENTDVKINSLVVTLAFGDFNGFENLIIDETLVSNCEEEIEDIESVPEEVESELIKEEIETFFDYYTFTKNIEFNIDDKKLSSNITCNDLKEIGFEIDKTYDNELLQPETFSVEIEHYYKDTNNYITVSYLNNTEEELSILECPILSININGYLFDNLSINDKNLFELTNLDIKDIFGEPTFISELELSTIYTYQDENKNFVEFQFVDDLLINIKIQNLTHEEFDECYEFLDEGEIIDYSEFETDEEKQNVEDLIEEEIDISDLDISVNVIDGEIQE